VSRRAPTAVGSAKCYVAEPVPVGFGALVAARPIPPLSKRRDHRPGRRWDHRPANTARLRQLLLPSPRRSLPPRGGSTVPAIIRSGSQHRCCLFHIPESSKPPNYQSRTPSPTAYSILAQSPAPIVAHMLQSSIGCQWCRKSAAVNTRPRTARWCRSALSCNRWRRCSWCRRRCCSVCSRWRRRRSGWPAHTCSTSPSDARRRWHIGFAPPCLPRTRYCRNGHRRCCRRLRMRYRCGRTGLRPLRLPAL
jgi:hypothetical protein